MTSVETRFCLCLSLSLSLSLSLVNDVSRDTWLSVFVFVFFFLVVSVSVSVSVSISLGRSLSLSLALYGRLMNLWMTHEYLRHDSFICVTKLLHMYDMIHTCVCHDAHIYVTRLIHMCNIPHTHVWQASYIHVWHDSYTFTCVIRLTHLFHGEGHQENGARDFADDWYICVTYLIHVHVTCLIHVCGDMTHTHVWYVSHTSSVKRGTERMELKNVWMTHTYVWHTTHV